MDVRDEYKDSFEFEYFKRPLPVRKFRQLLKEGFIIVEHKAWITMMQQTVPTTELPTELNSPAAKLVYLYLSTHDGASLSELQAGLSMKKISLYSILGTLCKRNLVQQRAEEYRVTQ